ncbi:hypothetical protein BLNAU_4500 [Blattamonas nauphoetae]|uniref:Uncharacterized protein n=1 Tax=Blattamonas nauphoetae TaxID=2049346 RepID=A0ABQ9YA04_9EUKA|nr:hypothetical protein BLNAU_4500 [Blattamonas nauphoetae]
MPKTEREPLVYPKSYISISPKTISAIRRSVDRAIRSHPEYANFDAVRVQRMEKRLLDEWKDLVQKNVRASRHILFTVFPENEAHNESLKETLIDTLDETNLMQQMVEEQRRQLKVWEAKLKIMEGLKAEKEKRNQSHR